MSADWNTVDRLHRMLRDGCGIIRYRIRQPRALEQLRQIAAAPQDVEVSA